MHNILGWRLRFIVFALCFAMAPLCGIAQDKSSSTDTNNQLYTNQLYRLEFMYPSSWTLEESVDGRFLNILLNEAQENQLRVSAEKGYDEDIPLLFMDSFAEGEKVIGQHTWQWFPLRKGYGDGPGFSGPIFALRRESGDIRYSVSWFQHEELSEEQLNIIASFSFSESGMGQDHSGEGSSEAVQTFEQKWDACRKIGHASCDQLVEKEGTLTLCQGLEDEASQWNCVGALIPLSSDIAFCEQLSGRMKGYCYRNWAFRRKDVSLCNLIDTTIEHAGNDAVNCKVDLLRETGKINSPWPVTAGVIFTFVLIYFVVHKRIKKHGWILGLLIGCAISLTAATRPSVAWILCFPTFILTAPKLYGANALLLAETYAYAFLGNIILYTSVFYLFSKMNRMAKTAAITIVVMCILLSGAYYALLLSLSGA